MNLSLYNRYVLCGNDVVVYNTKYGNAIAFEEQSNIDEVKKFLKEESSKELEDLGFITSDNDELNTQKYEYYKLKFGFSQKLNIMLIMTYECNCSCLYCFENLLTYPMDDKERISEVIEYLSELYKANNNEEMDLHFFGGEPTLRTKDMILIYRKLLEKGLNINPNVITNGTLLDQNVVNELIHAGISTFQITLDGPRDVHDFRRPMKNGDSSWEVINKNLSILVKEDASINIRINIAAKNVEYLSEICQGLPEAVKKHPYTTIYIAPVVGCKINSFQHTIKDRAIFLKKAWNIIKEKNLPICIAPPVYAPCPYSSYEAAFYIDLFGNVYTCGGFVGKKEKVERVLNKKTERFWNRINDEPKDTCYKCVFFPVCMGGCKFEEESLGEKCQYSYLMEIYDEYYTKYAIDS